MLDSALDERFLYYYPKNENYRMGGKVRLRFEGCSTFKSVDRMMSDIVSKISHIPVIQNEDTIFRIKIAFRELLNNAVEHGNKMNISKKIICEFSYDDHSLWLKVTDQGEGFNIADVLRKNSEEPLDRERLRGIMMLKSLGFVVDTFGNQVMARFDIHKNEKGKG